MKFSKVFLATILLLIISAFTSFAQNTVKGIITDKVSNKVLPFANIMVYNTDETKLITYSVSDNNGAYTLKMPSDTYIFKVSFLGYNAISIKKKVSSNNTVNFKLKPSNNELKEIVVEGKAIDLIIKNDTVRYNLKSLTTGNEANLKEILAKLPGIEIDKNGKIKANGKLIDKLMIDGKEFFGDQHQLATENISSEMVDGVSLLNNFKDFDQIDTDKRSSKTAMNIEIKDEYKGKIKGNITLAGGYKNKYELKSNWYTFTNKFNFFLIASGNNIGKETFSFLDYINFQGGMSKFMGGQTSKTLSNDDLPSFLFTDDKIKSKDEQIIALNASYQASKKLKVNSYIIFNRSNTQEEELIKQTYLVKNKGFMRNLRHGANNTFLVNTSFLEISYKPSKKSSLNYSANFSPQKSDKLKDDAFVHQSYNSEYNNINYSFNQTLSYNQKIEKFFFKTNLYHKLKNKDKDLHILSDKEFLDLTFNNTIYSVGQEMNQSSNNYGLSTSLSRKVVKNLSVSLSYNIAKNNEVFKTSIIDNNLKNDIKLNTLEHLIGLSFNNGSKALILYRFGVNYNILNMHKDKIEDLLPFAGIKLNFSSSHYLDLSYTKSISTPTIKDIIENPYISSFNSFTANQDVFCNTFARKHNFNLQYSIYDDFSGTLISLNGKYNIRENEITNNTINSNDYYTSFYTLSDKYYEIFGELILNKSFSAIPFKLNLRSYYSINNDGRFIENQLVDFKYEKYFIGMKFSSKFKQWFNFEAGYDYKYSTISNDNMVSEFTLNKAYAKLLFDYKQLNVTIDGSYEDYKSNLLNHNFVRIDPSIRYKSANKKWEFHIKAKDILQLNKNEIISTSTYANYIAERYISVMGGYVLCGVKYQF